MNGSERVPDKESFLDCRLMEKEFMNGSRGTASQSTFYLGLTWRFLSDFHSFITLSLVASPNSFLTYGTSSKTIG